MQIGDTLASLLPMLRSGWVQISDAKKKVKSNRSFEADQPFYRRNIHTIKELYITNHHKLPSELQNMFD